MRTILISGASRGIGRAIALKAIEDGHRVSLGVRNPKDLKGSKLDPGVSGFENVLVSKYDAKLDDTAKDWVNRTHEKFGGFDSLINCAGIFHRTRFLFLDKEKNDIEELWKVNVMGPWILTKDAWKYLINSTSARIIVLVSMSGKRSKGNLASYSMSKFALMSLCQTMRNEGWEKGIRVTAICPGWVNTDMAKGIKHYPKKDMSQANDIASICSNLLTLPNSSIPFEIALNCQLETNI